MILFFYNSIISIKITDTILLKWRCLVHCSAAQTPQQKEKHLTTANHTKQQNSSRLRKRKPAAVLHKFFNCQQETCRRKPLLRAEIFGIAEAENREDDKAEEKQADARSGTFAECLCKLDAGINKDRENENAENREQAYAVSQCDFTYVIGVQIEIIPCDNLNKMS